MMGPLGGYTTLQLNQASHHIREQFPTVPRAPALARATGSQSYVHFDWMVPALPCPCPYVFFLTCRQLNVFWVISSSLPFGLSLRGKEVTISPPSQCIHLGKKYNFAITKIFTSIFFNIPLDNQPILQKKPKHPPHMICAPQPSSVAKWVGITLYVQPPSHAAIKA